MDKIIKFKAKAEQISANADESIYFSIMGMMNGSLDDS